MAFVILALAVTLLSPFGAASAAARVDGATLRIEVSVEVSAPATAVLARVVGVGEELGPVALSDFGDGRWGGIVELPVVENVRVGFELIPPEGPGTVSELRTLVELGVDPVLFAPASDATATTVDSRFTVEANRWGWLALAAGAAALAVLVIWAWWDRSRPSTGSEEEVEPNEAVGSRD